MSNVDYIYRYRCPVCFVHWYEANEEEQQQPLIEEGTCGYCKGNKFQLGKLIDRQIDIIEQTSVDDFPKIVRNIWTYVRKGETDVV